MAFGRSLGPTPGFGGDKLPRQQGKAAGKLKERGNRTLWGDAWRRLKKNRLALFGFCWIVFLIIVAISADLWAPKLLGSPTFVDTTMTTAMSKTPPSLGHPFGTDSLGRDELVRVIYGARVSLAVGVIAMSISLLIGMVLGTTAAFFGGLLDSIIMRATDIFMAFPYVLFAIALLAALGPSFTNMFLAIGLIGWTSIARVIRSVVLQIKENDYVSAARALGASNLRIIMRHILPNSIAPVVVYATMGIGTAIISEAALSFLGLGIQPPTPSWGLMISDAQQYLIVAPWLVFCPGLAILVTVLSFTLLGDGLRDAMDVKVTE